MLTILETENEVSWVVKWVLAYSEDFILVAVRKRNVFYSRSIAGCSE